MFRFLPKVTKTFLNPVWWWKISWACECERDFECFFFLDSRFAHLWSEKGNASGKDIICTFVEKLDKYPLVSKLFGLSISFDRSWRTTSHRFETFSPKNEKQQNIRWFPQKNKKKKKKQEDHLLLQSGCTDKHAVLPLVTGGNLVIAGTNFSLFHNQPNRIDRCCSSATTSFGCPEHPDPENFSVSIICNAKKKQKKKQNKTKKKKNNYNNKNQKDKKLIK